MKKETLKELNKNDVKCKTFQLVKDLADWSMKYGRGKRYFIMQTFVEDELEVLEKRSIELLQYLK